jgi:AraC-like DNA-binding protein
MTIDDLQLSHRPQRSHAVVSGPAELAELLENAYGARMRSLRIGSSGRRDHPLMTHARIDVGSFALDEIQVSGDVEVSPNPLNKVVAGVVVDGRLASRCNDLVGCATAGEVMMAAQPDLPHHSHAEHLHQIVLLMDPWLFAGIAADMPVDVEPFPIRFSTLTPAEAEAGRRWQKTVKYVKNVVLTDDALATPLILGAVGRLLAAVTLAAFPATATEGWTLHDRNGAQPVLLRRAIEFIEANVIEDIGLGHIAEAVCLTPRAVQYMFRRHLDMTPLQYLRRTRLHYAHTELLAADRECETVTSISARWGFSHTGRFAVFYRQTYGESPHTTLRN